MSEKPNKIIKSRAELLREETRYWPSVNNLVAPLLEDLIRDQQALRISAESYRSGVVIVDGGIDVPGGFEAGRRIAEICMGGVGHVTLHYATFKRWSWQVTVHTGNPVLACLGSQYAGWSLNYGSGKDAFHALGSGPARALCAKEPLFEELGYRDEADATCLVMEVSKPPPQEIIDKILLDCGIKKASKLTLILTPTRSIAGITQIVSRVLEVALHKAHAIGFPLHQIADGMGAAPLPPPAKDVLTAMGRTNDAILYGGQVHLYVHANDADAQDLANRLPSSASKDYGRTFGEIFKQYNNDFYKIDPMLFAPALVSVTAMETGRSFHAGKPDEKMLDRSFGGDG